MGNITNIQGDERDRRDLGDILDLYRGGHLKRQLRKIEEPPKRVDVRYAQVVCLVESMPPDWESEGSLHWRALVMDHRPSADTLVFDVVVQGFSSDAGNLFQLSVAGQTKTIPFNATAAEFHAACGFPDTVQVTLGGAVQPDRDPSETGANTPLYRWRVELDQSDAEYVPAVDRTTGFYKNWQLIVRRDAWVGTDRWTDVWFPIRPLTPPINALRSANARITWFPGSPTINRVEIQATGGFFRLSSDGTEYTYLLIYGMTANSIQSALVALEAIGAGNCVVTGTGTANDPYLVEYTGDLADVDMPPLLSTTDQLTGGNQSYLSTIVQGQPGEWRVIGDNFTDGDVLLFVWKETGVGLNGGIWESRFGFRPEESDPDDLLSLTADDEPVLRLHGPPVGNVGRFPPVNSRVQYVWFDDRWNRLEPDMYRTWFTGGNGHGYGHGREENPRVGEICVAHWTGRAWVVVERERRSLMYFRTSDPEPPYGNDPY